MIWYCLLTNIILLAQSRYILDSVGVLINHLFKM